MSAACCPECGQPIRPRRYGWTRAQVSQAILQWKYDHGTTPSYEEWRRKCPDGLRPSVSTVVRLFGSWAGALKETGYPPNPRGRPRIAAGPHATEARYLYRACRCVECRRARHAANERRRRARAAA